MFLSKQVSRTYTLKSPDSEFFLAPPISNAKPNK
jgi:hypothetical protein